MNPAIKRKWVDALRSGEYEQGRGGLRHHDKYCCLGVLTDLYHRATGEGKWMEGRNSGEYRFIGRGEVYSGAILLPEISQWAGFDVEEFLSQRPMGRYSNGSLLRDNDGDRAEGVPPKTFDEIAEIIEKHF